MPIVEIKGVGKAQFPDGMSADSIRSFLRNKYSQSAISGESDILAPSPNIATAYEPTLAEKMGQGVASVLQSTGLVSDNYGAQRIGRNVTALGEFLPGIGDATAGDEFGRAAAQGDNTGMLLAGIGAVPVVGDAAKGLYKTHNITQEGLEKAFGFGGLPVPSIAIADKSSGFDSFGDISLIGDKGAFSKDPTFASDVYSPRFPRSQDKIDYKAARAEEERLSGMVDPKIDSGFSSQFNPERLSEDLSRLEDSIGNKAAFLKGIGETIDPSKYTSAPAKPVLKMGDHGFAIKGKRLMPREALTNERHIKATDSWLREMEDKGIDVGFWRNEDGAPNEDALKTTYKGMREDRQAIEAYERGPVFDRFKAQDDINEKVAQNQEKFKSYIADQKNRISRGKVFTKWNPNNATTKEFDYNLANAVKLMKGNIRGGEGFSYGVGSIRAQVAPKLTSMKQITDRRGQIVGEDQMTMVKEGFNSRLDNLYDDLSDNWAWASDPSHSDFADGLENAAKGDFSDFKNLSKEQKGELQGFFDELANAPTNYFEVKPQRAVDIGEFYGAAVPEGTSSIIIKELKSRGLQVETYKPEKRTEAINKLNIKSGGKVFFSGAGAAMLYGAANQDDNKDNYQ